MSFVRALLVFLLVFFFFNDTATTEIYTLSLHDALPICGAGLGAVVALALHLSGPWALPLAAFGGALVALALVFRMGLVGGAELDPRVLLLGGVAVGAFCGAVTTAIVSLAEATELRNAFLWLWGGFSGASWTTVLVMVVYAPLPLAVLAAAARPLDLLALG